jgi:hypothetical protein
MLAKFHEDRVRYTIMNGYTLDTQTHRKGGDLLSQMYFVDGRKIG